MEKNNIETQKENRIFMLVALCASVRFCSPLDIK